MSLFSLLKYFYSLSVDCEILCLWTKIDRNGKFLLVMRNVPAVYMQISIGDLSVRERLRDCIHVIMVNRDVKKPDITRPRLKPEEGVWIRPKQ